MYLSPPGLEIAERETENILDRALLRAQHNKINGVISAADYHRIAGKVDSLKKLAFTELMQEVMAGLKMF